MITVAGVRAEDADVWWPRVSDWCQAALDRAGNLMTLDDVKERIIARDMQLWVIHVGDELKAVSVSEIIQWPQMRVITGVLTGGVDMPQWIDALVDVLSRYGHEQGCVRLDCHGRRGWKKPFEALGCKEIAVTFTKGI